MTLQPPAKPASSIRPSLHTARRPVRCATCGRPIATGEPYRRDTWAHRLFGRTLSSAICRDCVAAGL